MDQAESVVVDQRVAESDAKAARWAGARFAEAQLPLPAIRVSFHEDQEPCNGAQGLARLDDGVSRVLVCVPGDAIARDLKVKRTLLHEYASLRDHFSLTDEVRAEFMAHRGSGGWLRDSSLPYEEQAGEQAAENIM